MANEKLTLADITALLKHMYALPSTNEFTLRFQSYAKRCPHCGRTWAVRSMYADWLCLACAYLFYDNGAIAFTSDEDVVDQDGRKSELADDIRLQILLGNVHSIDEGND